MSGSLAGHGAAWPLPNVVNAALHAALHRAELDQVHAHQKIENGEPGKREKKFGSLASAGPFPVRTNDAGSNSSEKPSDTWFFPRPADLLDDKLFPALLPSADALKIGSSSLPSPLRYATPNRLRPKKELQAKDWITRSAFEKYLTSKNDNLQITDACNDKDFFDTEHSIGIAIDPTTQTTGSGDTEHRIYSAHYLRLRDNWALGVIATALDKVNGDPSNRRDLIPLLLKQDHRIVVGGQQRVCTAQITQSHSPSPLPKGMHTGFNASNGKHLVKWILLSPGVWPEIPAQSREGEPMTPHPGGWLPNWIAGPAHPEDLRGRVLLKLRHNKRRTGRKRHAERETQINARLVAAVIPKPIPVTGWALGDTGQNPDPPKHGAKSTHLAVPAGAVYYFETDSADDAANLALALNWHGASDNTSITNRRSTLLGEKGFGLGVCGTWNFYEDVK